MSEAKRQNKNMAILKMSPPSPSSKMPPNSNTSLSSSTPLFNIRFYYYLNAKVQTSPPIQTIIHTPFFCLARLIT